MTGPLACPSCGARHAASERFCADCGLPLVFAPGFEPAQPKDSERRDWARKIHPSYAEGPLTRVGSARHQVEAEFLQQLLLEEGIPSLVRRSGGFDVPDFLASGPRDIVVPASGAAAARAVLGAGAVGDGGGPTARRPASERTPAWVRALAVALAVVIVAAIAGAVIASTMS